MLSNNNICYVCSFEDDERIKRMFQTAEPNTELSKFPDFVCAEGFIEHFEVTSSHSNRHGSTMKREKNELLKEAEIKEKALKAEMNEIPCYE